MTNIQWTDVTDNPVIVENGGWWCKKISPGCANCYAEKLNKNSFFGGNFQSYSGNPPQLTLKRELIKSWARMRTPRKHFVASMTDVFGEWVSIEWQFELLDGMAAARNQTFQLLTKRPAIMAIAIGQWLRIQGVSSLPSNIWVGTSVENQKCADERIPELLKIPASVRFLSVEPILEGITLESIASYATKPQNCLGLDKINWVIVGGESGKNARPCRVEWLISIVKQCGRAKVPVFVKQLGSNPLGTNCIRLQDKKGGDITEFPDELQARHFPC